MCVMGAAMFISPGQVWRLPPKRWRGLRCSCLIARLPPAGGKRERKMAAAPPRWPLGQAEGGRGYSARARPPSLTDSWTRPQWRSFCSRREEEEEEGGWGRGGRAATSAARSFAFPAPFLSRSPALALFLPPSLQRAQPSPLRRLPFFPPSFCPRS